MNKSVWLTGDLCINHELLFHITGVALNFPSYILQFFSVLTTAKCFFSKVFVYFLFSFWAAAPEGPKIYGSGSTQDQILLLTIFSLFFPFSLPEKSQRLQESPLRPLRLVLRGFRLALKGFRQAFKTQERKRTLIVIDFKQPL